MRELSAVVSMAFACLFAAVAVGGVIPPSKPGPAPVAAREPVPYCRAPGHIGVPEMGPGRGIIQFAPCEHMKEERDA